MPKITIGTTGLSEKPGVGMTGLKNLIGHPLTKHND